MIVSVGDSTVICATVGKSLQSLDMFETKLR